MIKSLSAVAACLLLGTGIAKANSTEGRILLLAVRASDGLHVVEIDGQRVGQPACATHSYYMIKDEHSDVGKAQLAILLAAYMSGKSVMIEGSGTCTRWSDGEDIEAVTLR